MLADDNTSSASQVSEISYSIHIQLAYVRFKINKEMCKQPLIETLN